MLAGRNPDFLANSIHENAFREWALLEREFISTGEFASLLESPKNRSRWQVKFHKR